MNNKRPCVQLEMFYRSCLSEENTDLIDIITWEQGWRHITDDSCYTLYYIMVNDLYEYQ